MLRLSSTFLNYFSAAFQVKAALPAFQPAAVVRQLAYNTTPIAFCQLLFQTFFQVFFTEFFPIPPFIYYITLYTTEKRPELQKPRVHNKAGKSDLFGKI